MVETAETFFLDTWRSGRLGIWMRITASSCTRGASSKLERWAMTIPFFFLKFPQSLRDDYPKWLSAELNQLFWDDELELPSEVLICVDFCGSSIQFLRWTHGEVLKLPVVRSAGVRRWRFPISARKNWCCRPSIDGSCCRAPRCIFRDLSEWSPTIFIYIYNIIYI